MTEDVRRALEWREKHCDEGCPVYTDMERKGAALLLSLQAAEAREKRLREALGNAAARFRWYESLHMDKSPPDTEKAKSNAEMAAYCEAALATATQPAPEEGREEADSV